MKIQDSGQAKIHSYVSLNNGTAAQNWPNTDWPALRPPSRGLPQAPPPLRPPPRPAMLPICASRITRLLHVVDRLTRLVRNPWLQVGQGIAQAPIPPGCEGGV